MCLILISTASASFASADGDDMAAINNITDISDDISAVNIENDNNQKADDEGALSALNSDDKADEVLLASSNEDVLSASEVYISPTGSSSGDGSMESPYDWDTAYSNVDDGGTIYFLNGTYLNIKDKEIKKSINLIGVNDEVVLDNQGTANRFFLSYPNSQINVKICNLTFNNSGKLASSSFDGGAIDFDSNIINLDVKNCIFKNLKAAYAAAFCFQVGSGSNLSVTNCAFINNTVVKDGGSIWIESGVGNVYFKNNVFINCSSANGGAIYFSGSVNDLKFDNVNFTNVQSTDGYGGGVYIGGDVTNLEVVDSNVFTSSSTKSGGAFMFNGAITSLTWNNVNFTNAKITKDNYYGGAVYFKSIPDNSIFNNTNFIKCSATKYGGAFYLENAVTGLTFSNCIFIGNSIDHEGGSLYFKNKVGLKIINCNFTNGSSNYGGDIYFESSSTGSSLNVTDCNFINSYAKTNGGVFCTWATVSSLSFTNVNITDAHTGNSGGAIYFYTEVNNIKLDNVNFTDVRSTGGNGGAIYFNNQVNGLTILKSSFTNNTAVRGGAIYLNSHCYDFNMSNCNFTENKATTHGGAINQGSQDNYNAQNFYQCRQPNFF